MAGLFKNPAFHDSVLGRLERSGGLWRGTLTMSDETRTPLTLFGSNREPDAEALAAARQIAPSLAAWRPSIQQALFGHHAPYAEAVAADDPSARGSTKPIIQTPDQVWAQVSLQSVTVTRLGGVVVTDLVYAAAWDDDHLLGARFQSGQFIELCGSV
jgi:hypothetical protein